MTNKILLIINPISGQRRSHRHLAHLIPAIRQAGYDLRDIRTNHAGHATELVKSADPDTRAVLAYGGDGTVREVAAALAGSPIPMFHLAAGNENLFAKHFGMKLRIPLVLQAIKEHRTRNIDMMDVNGKLCTACMGVGFDAEIVKLVVAGRTGHVSHLDYVGPFIKMLVDYTWPVLTVHADGKEVFQGNGMIYGGNLTRYAMGLPLFKHALDDDGLMDIVIFPCRTRRRFLKDFLLTFMDRHRNEPNIYIHARTLTVTADRHVPSQVDGDQGPDLPMTLNMHPKALNVLLP